MNQTHFDQTDQDYGFEFVMPSDFVIQRVSLFLDLYVPVDWA